MDAETTARLAYLLILLAAVGGWLVVEFRQRFGQMLRTAVAWSLIIVGLMAGYGLWQDIRSDIRPSQAVLQSGEVRVPRAEDGHYYLTLTINGTPITFMADTGASNVVLSEQDARRLGIDPASLRYIAEARTANGSVRIARVSLPEVSFGKHSDQNVTAWVNEGALDMSLLGMDYLGLYHIQIGNNEMILQR
jgi:aspartyl protease family protein